MLTSEGLLEVGVEVVHSDLILQELSIRHTITQKATLIDLLESTIKLDLITYRSPTGDH
jgi:hypothetical protein